MRSPVKFVAIIALVVAASAIVGLLFGILPCYVFPAFGANAQAWCGYKSEPPHFLLQFSIGFLLSAMAVSYWLHARRGRRAS